MCPYNHTHYLTVLPELVTVGLILPEGVAVAEGLAVTSVGVGIDVIWTTGVGVGWIIEAWNLPRSQSR